MRKRKVESPFAKNLKLVMTEKRLTVRQAAKIAGVSPSVLQDWLSGTVPHDLQAVARFCNSTEIKADFQWLVTGTHSQGSLKDIALSEIFDIESDPSFSGIFMIEAKRLKRKER